MPKVLLPQTMTEYACNQKGCCCQGWGIPFQPEDVATLLKAFPAAEREDILEGAQVDVDGENKLQYIRLRTVGEARACQFLTPVGQCGAQMRFGPEPLPHLCRSFPAFAHDAGGPLEIHFDAVCPEVLTRLGASDGPLDLVELDVPEDHDLAIRARRPMALPEIVMGEQVVALDDLRRVRGRILEALAKADRPALDVLGAINYALHAYLEGTPVEAFRVPEDAPTDPFDQHLEACVRIHEDRLLAYVFWDFRRFVFALDLGAVDWSTLAAHLTPRDDWREHLDPRREDLQPLFRRYLAHRFFSAFDRSPNAHHLTFTYGTINHAFGTALRYAVGIASWLGRPVDRDVMLVAMGAAEYCFRIFRVPQSSMPWFGLESVRL